MIILITRPQKSYHVNIRFIMNIRKLRTMICHYHLHTHHLLGEICIVVADVGFKALHVIRDRRWLEG